MNKYIPIIAAPLISFTAYYARTNNYSSYKIEGYDLGNKLCEIPEVIGHFITKHLIVEGFFHHLKILGFVTSINTVTSGFANSQTIISEPFYYIYSPLPNILSLAFSPINNLMEFIEMDLGIASLLLFSYDLFKKDIKAYAEYHFNFVPALTHIQDWYENSGKGTSIEPYYNTVNNIWDVVHPFHHFAEAHQLLDKKSEIQELVGTLLTSAYFYKVEFEEIIEGLNNLKEAISSTYSDYISVSKIIETSKDFKPSLDVCTVQDEYTCPALKIDSIGISNCSHMDEL